MPKGARFVLVLFILGVASKLHNHSNIQTP